IWQPEPKALKKIRDKIAGDPKAWGRATTGGILGSTCRMAGESLKRPPAGYDPAHPFIDDIKRKDCHQHSADRSGSDRRRFPGSGASETPRHGSFRAVLVECRWPVLRCYGNTYNRSILTWRIQ